MRMASAIVAMALGHGQSRKVHRLIQQQQGVDVIGNLPRILVYNQRPVVLVLLFRGPVRVQFRAWITAKTLRSDHPVAA